MRGGGFPGRETQGLSLLLYSPGSHGEHIKCSPARAELATNLTPGRPARESNVLVGATLPAKKGQVNFGRFYLGKRRAPAPVRSHLSHENRRRFGSMRQIMNLPSTRAFRDNKPAGKALEHMRCGRPIKILPHTSAIQTNIAQNNRPFNAK